jgi:hypothetical protein
MLLCCVCIASVSCDNVRGTEGEAADEAVAAAATVAGSRCSARLLPPVGVAACATSVMAVSKGERNMVNTMRCARTGTDVCGEWAVEAEERVADGRNRCRWLPLLCVC